MLPVLDAAPCTFQSWFGVVPCGTTGVITITLGQLAILGIGGFFAGLAFTVAMTLYRWRYGIWTVILREVGVTYREVYRKLQKPECTDFEKKMGKHKMTYLIDLSRAVWLDNHNRPMLVYLQDVITPLLETDLTMKLREAIAKELSKKRLSPEQKKLLETSRGAKLNLLQDSKRPAEPFSIFFGRRGAEMVIRAVTGKAGTHAQAIGLAVLFAIMALVIGYFLGSALPYTNYIHTATTAISSTTSSTTSSGLPVLKP